MRRRRRWLGVVGLAVIAAGCGTDCTAIGCIDGVSVDVAEEFSVDLLPVEVTLCAGETCETEVIDRKMAGQDAQTFRVSPIVTLDEGREANVPVSLVVRSTAAGAELINASGTAHLTRRQPNGKGCDPICFGDTLVYDAANNELLSS